MKAECQTLIHEISCLIDGYRQGELDTSSESRVAAWYDNVVSISTWIDDGRMRELFLEAVLDALTIGYWSRPRIRATIESLDCVSVWPDAPHLLGGDWSWLHLQGPAASQSALLALLPEDVRQSEGDNRHFTYMDDGVFSGGTVVAEVEDWLRRTAPVGARLLIAHLAGSKDRILTIQERLRLAAAPKQVDVRMVAALHFAEPGFHDRQPGREKAVVGLCLRPTRSMYEQSDACATYRQRFGWRHRDYVFLDDGPARCEGVFRTAEHRFVLTRALLEVGCKIMMWTKQPAAVMRPLGYDKDPTFGVGAVMATFHNAPNTSPLAMWWGNPRAPDWHPFSRWTPLLPRRPAPEIHDDGNPF